MNKNLPLSLACLAALLIGLFIGAQVVHKTTKPYIQTVTQLDPRWFALVIISMGLAGSWMAAGLTGVLIALAGLGVALFLRAAHVSNQVAMSALAAPVLIYYLGLVPFVNGVLY